MADRYRQANGTWNDGNWFAAASGGSPLGIAPEAGDTVFLNSKTVALDVSTAALTAIYAGVAASSTGTGNITCSVNGLSITATTLLAGTATLITFSGTGAFIINGVLIGSTAGMEAFGLLNTAAGTVSITEIRGGGNSGMSCHGVKNTGVGASFIFTTVKAGTGMDANGFYSAVVCSIQATNVYAGTNTAGPSCIGISCTAAATLTVVNAYGSNGMDSAAIKLSAAAVLNVTNVIGSTESAIWLTSGAAIVTATNVTGGVAGGGYAPYGIWCYSGTPTVKISGGILSPGNGANTYGIYSPGASHLVTLENATVINTALCQASNSNKPITILAAQQSNYFQFGTYKFPLQLAASNVKKGVVHGDITGTLVSGGGGSGGGWIW
ncbi:MAG: hypothetical protein UV78_C0006G0016 [Parcubacteria group bacterium GW2011_GWA2_43_17]|nr:MAG: hypothetical protein UV78_C0006G0016 [Parcubacteria group bacterium GW2011_GWA2_43_17]OHB42966.1 MAG: hypothetical protein A2Y13_12100 [Planctomycetes bacterium GWC2_45_44]HBR20289.1 hypothetical protein [Phycisphaerales bacterium]